jgi:structural maintenance of chromosome 4
VFGKRASKLRLNKVSQLIHKSSDSRHEQAASARVSVYFHEIVDTGEGDEDYTVVPGSETVVSRVVKKDNSSQYKLQGKNCQFKDVANFLGGKGVDLDNNRFLILQGEVELISMMPPVAKTPGGDEGLLEYLEDIIGSNKFVEETEKAAEQMESLTDARQEKLNRVKAVEKEKDSLESAKQEAEALLGKEREIRRKQNILYQIHAMNASQQAEKYSEQMEDATQRLEEARGRIKDEELRCKEIERGLKKQQNGYDKVHAELVHAKDEFAAYQRRDVKLREEMKHAKAQQKKLQTKCKQQEKKEAEAVQAQEEAEESIPKLEQKIADLTDRKEEEDAKLDEIQEKTKGVTHQLRTQLEEKTAQLAPVQQERAVFQATLDTATTEVQLLEANSQRAKEKLAEAEKELANLDEKQQSKRQQLADAEDELAKSKERIEEAQAEEKSIAEKEVQLSKRHKMLMVRSLSQSCLRHHREAKTNLVSDRVQAQAEEAKAALQSKGNARSSAVKGILEAARKGGELARVGIIGRLGDLATIPEDYDVAVSTACGTLDHIVVRTTAGVQECLKFLRKHGLGRASFIPLDKMSKGAHDRKVQTPEDAPRLFELISPMSFDITPAIFHGVGNTLVAPDLETATRWAYEYEKRWRVVTVDGKLIETAGTMSGGGKSVRRGGMKLAVSSYSSDCSTDCRRSPFSQPLGSPFDHRTPVLRRPILLLRKKTPQLRSTSKRKPTKLICF